jgi:hypothetical protein
MSHVIGTHNSESQSHSRITAHLFQNTLQLRNGPSLLSNRIGVAIHQPGTVCFFGEIEEIPIRGTESCASASSFFFLSNSQAQLRQISKLKDHIYGKVIKINGPYSR